MKKPIPLKELAKLVGVSLPTVYRWLNLEFQPKADKALKLEEITGVQAYAWLFPDRYRNPYFEAYRAKRKRTAEKEAKETK